MFFKNICCRPYPPGFFVQGTSFDFFNYAGIHRPVMLYLTPQVFIRDVTIVTQIGSNNTGNITFKIWNWDTDL